jgi:hypothetical protein
MVSGNEGPLGTISRVHRLVIMSVQITVQCTMFIYQQVSYDKMARMKTVS